MKRLDGEWLAFMLPHEVTPQTAAERLVEGIRRFNERFGAMPVMLGLSTDLDEQAQQVVTEAAQRLGLEVHVVSHIRRRDFWLGPVEKKKS